MLPDYTDLTAASVADRAAGAIAESDALVDAMLAADGPRTYQSTIAPLDRVGVVGADVYATTGFMARVHPDPDVRAAGTEAGERLTKWAAELVFRDELAAAVREYADGDEAAELTGTRRRALDFWVRDLRRAGHELEPAQRERVRALRRRLIELEVGFETNLGEWHDHLVLHRNDLDGLPEAYVDRLAPGEEPGTYLVTMDYPDYFPFMDEANRRDLRRDLQFKFWNRAADENGALLGEAISVRREIADLLGYDTWADYAMEVKMAGPASVEEMYASIVPGLTERGEAELAVLQQMLDEDAPGERFEAWDWKYYDTLQRKRDFGIDPNEVAAYFPLDAVVDGMFSITGDVFGLEYRRVDAPSSWHPDVVLYEILDRSTGRVIAAFYADLFPRDGKFGHAACFPLVGGMALPDGTYREPVAAIVANFTKPTASSPSLLKHSEALTLFHEFGHVLHFCLTEVDHPRFAGFDAEWDFVEAPSQIMENWMWEPEVLRRFARHHETGAPIPDDLVERLVAARDQNVGLDTLRQVFLGNLDLDLHTGSGPVDLDAAYRRSFEFSLLPFHEGTHFPAGFGHLMGGYDAGYYGYQWAKVYGDDMFSEFAAAGVLNPEIGARYRREVLATGGSRDAIEHLRAFLGREPSSDAYLKRLGIVTALSDAEVT